MRPETTTALRNLGRNLRTAGIWSNAARNMEALNLAMPSFVEVARQWRELQAALRAQNHARGIRPPRVNGMEAVRKAMESRDWLLFGRRYEGPDIDGIVKRMQRAAQRADKP